MPLQVPEHDGPERRADLDLLLDRQHAVITRAQARSIGLSAANVERRIRTGEWVRVHPTVYRDTGRAPSPLTAYRAAALWAGPDGAVSHASAAALWRLLPPMPGPVEVVVPVGRSADASGLRVRRTRTSLGVEDTARVAGVRVTSPARTVIDLAAALGEVELARVEIGRAHV